jgi:uncharacterized protein (TIGR04255 family)
MRQHVKFDRPPVVEVVCGVRFNTGGRIKLAHLGAFWATLKDAYPVAEEAAPIMRAPIDNEPDLVPRTWLITADGSELLQLQKDWFLLNWKKADDSHPYPSYSLVKSAFDKRFGEFSDFLASEGIDINYRELELTYVNHISNANGLGEVEQGELFVDHLYSSNDRFLPTPVQINWKTSYVLPKGYGRLNVTAQTGMIKSTGERLIRLDLQALGLPGKASRDQMEDWFEVAHEWITRGFVDITAPKLHELWGRTL